MSASLVADFIVEHFGLAMFLLPWLVLAASQFPSYHYKRTKR